MTPEIRQQLVEGVRDLYPRGAEFSECLFALQVRNDLYKFGLHRMQLEDIAREVLSSLPKPSPVPPKPRQPTERDAEQPPELLPFSKLPGYLLDAWGVPHRQVGQGRKPGKVRPENVLFHRKGKKGVQHSARYSLTVDGARKRFSPKYLLRARLHAESEHRERQREKLPLPDCQLPEVALSQAGATL